MNGKKIIDLNIDDWNEPNKNPDGSKNKFKTALNELPKRVISASNITVNPFGSGISKSNPYDFNLEIHCFVDPDLEMRRDLSGKHIFYCVYGSSLTR